MFQGVQPAEDSGQPQTYETLGFEYWSDPNDREAGFITWQVAGQATHQVGAGAVGPDPLPAGSGVGQRLISEEPMSIVLNLGISGAFAQISSLFLIELTTVFFVQRTGSLSSKIQ